MFGKLDQVAPVQEFCQQGLVAGDSRFFRVCTRTELFEKLLGSLFRGSDTEAVLNIMAQDIRDAQVKKFYFTPAQEVFLQKACKFLQRNFMGFKLLFLLSRMFSRFPQEKIHDV